MAVLPQPKGLSLNKKRSDHSRRGQGLWRFHGNTAKLGLLPAETESARRLRLPRRGGM
jgi:hypothetical protein